MCTQSGTQHVLIETLSVREAREQLPTVLERFRNGDRTPVGVGSHRRTEAVMVPADSASPTPSGCARSKFAALADERHLCGLDRDTFLDRLTHYFAEVNAIHPFREGNGRTQRAFFRQLSQAAGWRLDWSNLDPAGNASASMSSLRGDNEPLHSLLESLVTNRAV